ncbi:imidazolonepropionase [Longimicrobium terrae]|uniref:Imidazolonepropionase n=1 Tax=Longimicrobium terrae TaxID=1639882 RepID=A0A841GUJ4_9BACT|nr:imidazolonepropionase [Longimicrobium terrae]MBB4634346.1 imidazolonepropionase [Longimicrobium terrae]MBB6068764.1 imidazolonepropionase [Longimicrobium terrae]NNC27949.1 imidazolonepropionase [Longimicrobium terrae]
MIDQPRTTVFVNAVQVAACTGPVRQTEDADPAAVYAGAAVAVHDGRIAAVGAEADVLLEFADAVRVDCAGGVLTPGFVDSHTHAVFGRYRTDEYALRCTGVPYMEIARRGGGINASVRDLRARSEDELVEMALPRLNDMLRCGTTTAEAKSGYGLSTADEIKTLRAIRRLNELQPIELIPTFLGGHEVPPEYKEDRGAYVDLLVSEMIPAVAEAGLARFCDVFMEPGVFDRAETERILRAGLAHGLRPKLHADELEGSGGAELGAELGAASVDHLGDISEAGISALAASSTVATLLPATLFFLGRPRWAPGRALIDAGATVALATDFNPGSSPTPNMHFVLTAACSRMGFSPHEALRAATAGGAAALELSDGRGTLAVGTPADLVLWRAQSAEEIPYRLAAPIVEGVWKAGEQVA